MKKRLIGLLSIFLLCSLCFAEEQNQPVRATFQDGKIKANTLYATEFTILKDIYEMNKQSYWPFFLKIINDKAYILYQRQPLPIPGEICFLQETRLSGTDQTKKQITLILSKMHEKLIPITFSFNDDYSLWYRMPGYDSFFDKEKNLKVDTPFITLGKSGQELVENLKKDNSFIPYGLSVATTGECTAIVLPTASLRLNDAKILTISLDDLESIQIPDGWSAAGADLVNKTIYVLLISYGNAN